MSGERNFVDEKLEKVINSLETISKSLLIDKINVNPEAEKYLSLTEDDLNKFTPAELAVGECLLSSYAFTVQRKMNRASAIKKWANTSLETIIAKNYKSFQEMMKYEIRKAAIALNDDYAKRLHAIIKEQDAITEDLTNLFQSITNISYSLGNLARIRSKGHYA